MRTQHMLLSRGFQFGKVERVDDKPCRAYGYPGGLGGTPRRGTPCGTVAVTSRDGNLPEAYSVARENMARARESARFAIRASRKIPARQVEERGAGADRRGQPQTGQSSQV